MHKPKAAAAIKKAEMQKKRSEIESQMAMQIQEQELALSRRKIKEKAQLEQLRLEEEAAIAVAKVTVIEDEFGISEQRGIDLPEQTINQRVKDYLDNQCEQEPTHVDHQSHGAGNQVIPPPHMTLVPLPPEHVTPPTQPLNPMISEFHPTTHISSHPNPSQHTMKSYIEFMARREVVANKIEKFDDKPANYHIWKESFRNMTRGINITPSEELLLIAEHTTNNSKRLVQQLHSAYIRNPEKGLIEALIAAPILIRGKSLL